MVESKPVIRRTTSLNILGREVASVIEEEFVLKEYPPKVKKSLARSSIPKELYPDALAVVGRAYGRVLSNWGDDRVGNNSADLAWRVPTPSDFEKCVDGLRQNVGVDELVELSDRLFGRNDTSPDVLRSMENELLDIFNPPETVST